MTPWLLARSSGVIAFVAFAISTVAGILLSSRFLGKKAGRTLTIVHEAASIAGLALVLVHAWAILNDTYFEFTWRSILVPGLSPYAPLAVGLGIGAAWLSVLVIASFYLRKKIGPRTWRRIHYTTPVMFGAMVAHGLMAGTDSVHPALLALYASSIGTVAIFFVYRVVTGIAASKRKRTRVTARSAKPLKPATES